MRPADGCGTLNLVATGSNQVVVQSPLFRLYIVAFLILSVGWWDWSLVRHGGVESWIFVAFATALGLAVGHRVFSVEVTSADDGTLIVRNFDRVHRMSRAQIESFQSHSTGGRLGRESIHALQRDGTRLRLDVTVSYAGIGERRNIRRLALLTAWLRSEPNR